MRPPSSQPMRRVQAHQLHDHHQRHGPRSTECAACGLLCDHVRQVEQEPHTAQGGHCGRAVQLSRHDDCFLLCGGIMSTWRSIMCISPRACVLLVVRSCAARLYFFHSRFKGTELPHHAHGKHTSTVHLIKIHLPVANCTCFTSKFAVHGPCLPWRLNK